MAKTESGQTPAVDIRPSEFDETTTTKDKAGNVVAEKTTQMTIYGDINGRVVRCYLNDQKTAWIFERRLNPAANWELLDKTPVGGG